MSNRLIFIGAADADAGQFEARARADFPGLDLYASNDRSSIFAHLEGAKALIGHHFQFDEDMLRRARALRWIQSLTTGTDAILQLAALRAEVTVTSTRGMHGPQMSELVFLQMLALLRNFPLMQRNQSAHKWDRWPQPLLAGKTIVIVGVGAIAEVLAPRCKAFGMTVLGISNSSRKPAGFDEILPRSELQRGAAVADFLVLIVPHSAQTENLIDASVLSHMKPSAYLINVARGGVLERRSAARRTARAAPGRRGARCFSRAAAAGRSSFMERGENHHHAAHWRDERCLSRPGLPDRSRQHRKVSRR